MKERPTAPTPQYDDSLEAMKRSVAQTEVEVRNLIGTVRDLKHSVEELVDRIDADIDALRNKAEVIGILQTQQNELTRRVGMVEGEVKTINLRVAFASGAVAVLSVLLKLLWK